LRLPLQDWGRNLVLARGLCATELQQNISAAPR